MNRLLAISLILSSFILGWCLKTEIKTEVPSIVQSGWMNINKTINVNSWIIEKIQSWTIENSWIKTNSTSNNYEIIPPNWDNPIIIWGGFWRTMLYVKDSNLYSFIVNDEERKITKWNNDFKIIDTNGYFSMWWQLYFANNAYEWALWIITNHSKLELFPCVSGLELDWNLFISGIKQEITFSGEKKCFIADFIVTLYDNSWIYILEIPTSWKLKYFPWINWITLKSISEDIIWDDRWNRLTSECGHGGCEYSRVK